MTCEMYVTGEKLAPVHHGEILLHDFIEPMGLTRYKVAKLASVPQRRIDEICSGNRRHHRCRHAPFPFIRHVRANVDEPASPI